MIQNSAMLIELNVSMWTGRKMDKRVSDEIDVAKNTKARGGNYHKKLMAGTGKLERVQTLVSALRVWHYKNTLPWADSGSRLLPMAHFFDYKTELNTRIQDIETAVDSFLMDYPTLVSAAAFQLGDLFDASEYPDVGSLRSKFSVSYVFLPVPMAGDFRIDVAEESKEELRSEYEKFFNRKLQDAMHDAWTRLYDCVKHLSERLADAPEAKTTKSGTVTRQRFHTTLITNANELCSLLSALNVTGDPKLEQARQALERAVNGATADSLKDSDELRRHTKTQIDAILDMF